MVIGKQLPGREAGPIRDRSGHTSHTIGTGSPVQYRGEEPLQPRWHEMSAAREG